MDAGLRSLNGWIGSFVRLGSAFVLGVAICGLAIALVDRPAHKYSTSWDEAVKAQDYLAKELIECQQKNR